MSRPRRCREDTRFFSFSDDTAGSGPLEIGVTCAVEVDRFQTIGHLRDFLHITGLGCFP